jgi:hypothetical protein
MAQSIPAIQRLLRKRRSKTLALTISAKAALDEWRTLMRFQILENWYVGTRLIPAGRIIDTGINPSRDDIANLVRGLTPPLHSLCLDQACADVMFASYGRYWWPYICCAPNVDPPP